MSTNIIRELERPPVKAPSLDPSLFKPSETQLEFLRSAISEDDEGLKARIIEVQKEAYDEYPYPCIRAFHFIELMMTKNPAYPEVLAGAQRSPESPVFLDLGCCMGSDVRKLAQDGYPPSSIVGCDLRPSYISLGHKLYRDSSSTLGIRFIAADIFLLSLSADVTPSNQEIPLDQVTSLADLRGRVTHLYTGALFHLFDEQTQLAIAQRLAILLTREKGAIIFGRHQGKVQEQLIDDHLGRLRYGHSPASWTRMWELIFRQSEGEEFIKDRLEVRAELSAEDTLLGIPIEHRQLTWSVHL